MKFIDLSHVIDPDIPLFSENVPSPEIHPWMSHVKAAASGLYEGTTCEISTVSFVTSIGTYLDSPFHFDPAGDSIEALTLDQLILPGIVVDCGKASANDPIEPDVLNGLDIAGKAVLFKTNWSKHWKQKDYHQHPFISEATAMALIDRGAKLAGVDFLVIDDTKNPKRPVHVNLLKNKILIVENLMNLEKLPAKNFQFHAIPAKYQGAAAFPIRAYAIIGG